MADALCGPSNALQNFQKHSQVDRTLQQDRLISRQGPSTGFRSQQPNAGILDPEFAAFEAGPFASPPPQFDSRPFQAPQVPRFAPQQPSALPDWANDFQRLHISSARPSSASPAPAVQQAPAIHHSPQASASWHQDFMQAQGMNTFQSQQPMFQHQQFPDMSWEYGQAPQFSPIAQGKQPVMVQQQEQFNADAFAAAFDAATQDALAEEDDALAMEIANEREEIEFIIAKKGAELAAKRMERQETNHLSGMEMSSDLPAHEAWPDDLQHDEIMMQEPVHEEPLEAVQEAEKQEPDHPPMVDEELARTAGHLLDSVSHETSEKFAGSVFLQLMRRLRDKEVTVEGENFVETGSSGTASPVLGLPPLTSIPAEEQDADLGRFTDEEMSGGTGEPADAGEPDVTQLPMPSRPLTPDIDPPAPLFEDWRQRLFNAFTP